MTKITVFAFKHYYPSGGMNDLVWTYDTLAQAKKGFKKAIKEKFWDGTFQFCEWNKILEEIEYETEAMKKLCTRNVYKTTEPRQEPVKNKYITFPTHE